VVEKVRALSEVSEPVRLHRCMKGRDGG